MLASMFRPATVVWLLAGWLGLLAAPVAAMTLTLSGTLKLTSAGKPLRAEEAAEAVVYWRPREPVTLEPPAEPLVVTTLRKTFIPRTLPLVVGSRVRFPNADPILHNVFSTTPGNAFDTGLYGTGEGETVTFTQPGLVRIYCNVHQSMVGHILVLDTPHYTRPDRGGRFQLELPPGAGELFVWHERATLWRKPLTLEPFSTLEITLDLSRRRVPAHLNKFGKPYRRDGSDYR
jgi:plastocyanin